MLFPGWETEIVTNKNEIRESGKSFSFSFSFFFFYFFLFLKVYPRGLLLALLYDIYTR